MVFKRMGGGLDFAPEPAVDQVGSAADMGMGEKQVVDLGGGGTGPLPRGYYESFPWTRPQSTRMLRPLS